MRKFQWEDFRERIGLDFSLEIIARLGVEHNPMIKKPAWHCSCGTLVPSTQQAHNAFSRYQGCVTPFITPANQSEEQAGFILAFE